MEPITLTIGSGILLAIIGYGVKRYIDSQDKKNDQFIKTLTDYYDRFTEAVDELQKAIKDLNINGAVHATRCEERHKQNDRELEAIKKKIGLL
jgi:diaminopimelate decarboxylase